METYKPTIEELDNRAKTHQREVAVQLATFVRPLDEKSLIYKNPKRDTNPPENLQ